MSSFLFDSNALVYWLYPGSPFHEDVSKFLKESLSQGHNIYALSSSLNDIYYALHRHYMSEKDARDSIRCIAELFDLVDLTGILVFEALDSDERDYEDSLIRASAEALQVNAIITYDKKAFKGSFIPKMTAEQALELVANSQQ